jgi:hypothetical protein
MIKMNSWHIEKTKNKEKVKRGRMVVMMTTEKMLGLGDWLNMGVKVAFSNQSLPVDVHFPRNTSVQISPVEFGTISVNTGSVPVDFHSDPIRIDVAPLSGLLTQMGVMLICAFAAWHGIKWLCREISASLDSSSSPSRPPPPQPDTYIELSATPPTLSTSSSSAASSMYHSAAATSSSAFDHRSSPSTTTTSKSVIIATIRMVLPIVLVSVAIFGMIKSVYFCGPVCVPVAA